MGESGIDADELLALLEEPRSISAVHRALGKKTHRLVLTGYLLALKDLGYLEERAYPPSKIFVIRKDREGELGERIRGAKQGSRGLEEELSDALGELAPQIAERVARSVEKREIKGAAEKREDLEEEEKDEQKE